MRGLLRLIGMGLLGVAAGCGSDQPPAPQRVSAGPVYVSPQPSKPLPPAFREDEVPAPPFSDPPLVSQRMPEERAFVDAYNAVGRPRILVFVNRSPQAPGVAPANFDETKARSLDYAAVENILTDWLAADGHVTIISPAAGQQALNEQQSHDLQSGRAAAGRDVARQVEAHILVQVQAQPTMQTEGGAQVRMVAEAVDLKHDGTSLARAVVDVPPPLDKQQINKYTRFLARKLMDGMIVTWQSAGTVQGNPPPAGNVQPEPTPTPTPTPTPPPLPQTPPQPQQLPNDSAAPPKTPPPAPDAPAPPQTEAGGK
ncbi:MAG: hypothetical protein JWN51_2902 [Phycisphaerales bacterium]|nr:hypothetical protein [Phycisphaerales bacterium]